VTPPWWVTVVTAIIAALLGNTLWWWWKGYLEAWREARKQHRRPRIIVPLTALILVAVAASVNSVLGFYIIAGTITGGSLALLWRTLTRFRSLPPAHLE